MPIKAVTEQEARIALIGIIWSTTGSGIDMGQLMTQCSSRFHKQQNNVESNCSQTIRLSLTFHVNLMNWCFWVARLICRNFDSSLEQKSAVLLRFQAAWYSERKREIKILQQIFIRQTLMKKINWRILIEPKIFLSQSNFPFSPIFDPCQHPRANIHTKCLLQVQVTLALILLTAGVGMPIG